MTDLDLAGLLAGVVVPAAGGSSTSFAVSAIPGFARHYIGRNIAGQPSLLLGSEPGPFHAPVRLALLEARFGTTHRIRPMAGQEREELLTAITCTSQDVQAHAYFVHVCETIVRIVGNAPTLIEVIGVVQNLIDLFRHLSRPAKRSLNGLLGELMLVASSRDTPATVTAWRNSDYDRFDFSAADVRLDVKAAADRARVHYLSAEQCQPPLGTVGLLASIFIESSGGGRSLRDLLKIIEGRLAGRGDLVMKVQQAVAETLGETLTAALDARFDEHLALSSLQFFDLKTVPAIRDNVPAEVSKIHFRSDISGVEPLDDSAIAVLAPLALAFLPQR